MSFKETIIAYRTFDIDSYCSGITIEQVMRILQKERITDLDFCALLSDSASVCLEMMAGKAANLTKRHFGNSVILFTPMYISDYCENGCPYCSFARHNDITRHHLSIDEVVAEASRISQSGIRHILMLTGESPSVTTISYLEEAILALRRHFASVSIEVYPLDECGYACCLAAGADTLTLYQETYNEPRYRQLHVTGPKSDYDFRLDAPERGCRAGMRAVTVAALYGLYDWRYDVFFAVLHAAYLQNKFPGVEVGLSFPRLRPLSGKFDSGKNVTDRQLVQMIAASRIFLPTSGITMSTRESADFRMGALPIGITKMSAGVSTSVGGHGGCKSTPQFEISDSRDVATIYNDLLVAGYQPIMHDWNYALNKPKGSSSLG